MLIPHTESIHVHHGVASLRKTLWREILSSIRSVMMINKLVELKYCKYIFKSRFLTYEMWCLWDGVLVSYNWLVLATKNFVLKSSLFTVRTMLDMNFIVASRHTRKMFRFLFVLCVINQYRGKEEKLLIYPWVTTLTEIASQTQPSKKEKYDLLINSHTFTNWN